MELLVFLIGFAIFMILANTTNMTDKDMVSK
jgi:hypothetical protein